MPYQATVYNVMIASPGDVLGERNSVRQLVEEWNIVNASILKTVLFALGWETHSTPLSGDRPQSIINSQVLDISDLLVAIFWTRLGTPTGEASSGTVEEIQRHVNAGKPALIYFSTAPVAPDNLDPEQFNALKAFRIECQAKGLYKSFDSTADFHEIFRRHLGLTINVHPYFEEIRANSPNMLPLTTANNTPKIPHFTQEAQRLLLEASNGNGAIMMMAYLGGEFVVQTNGKNFVEQHNARSRAVWEGTVHQLLRDGFLQSADPKGQVFRLTKSGFDAADLLRP